jgi:hypothetical protein
VRNGRDVLTEEDSAADQRSPQTCRAVMRLSPAMAVPSSTPVTGFSSPISPTVAAGRRRSPANHAVNASAVAMIVT